MARRRRYSRDNELERFLAGIVTLALVALGWYFFTNPAKSIAYILAVLAVVLLFIFLRKWWRKKHFNNLLGKLRSSGREEYLKIFISRFGLEGGKGEGYVFRDHKFKWDRINDLAKILRESRVISSKKDVFALLRFYIQEKEDNVTRESLHKEPQKFSMLTGAEFEKLLYRLFEAMGYKVELTGRSGDQGGDLVANKSGERILIQAKAYRDWSTGNAAVQQVVGALKYYDCNKAMVITTSHFTPEAIVLAKANQTELVSKEQLQELLLKYLGESWF
jgi:restriction system protein